MAARPGTLAILFILFICLNPATAGREDSLLHVAKSSKDKRAAAAAYIELGELLQGSDFKLSYEYARKACVLYKQANDVKGMARAYFNMGYSLTDLGKLDESLNNYLLALDMYAQTGDALGEGKCLNDIAYIYQYQGNLQEAMNYYKKALEIFEGVGDRENIAATTNNIGLLLHSQDDYKNALTYYLKSIEMKKELGNKKSLAMSYNNIGTIYLENNQLNLAMEAMEESLRLRREAGDKAGEAQSLVNIGAIYRKYPDYPKALNYFLEALKIQQELGNRIDLGINLNNVASVYLRTGELNLAEKYAFQAYTTGKELNYADLIKDASKQLSTIYVLKNDYKTGYKYLVEFKNIEDSLMSADAARKMTELRLQMEFGKERVAKEKEAEQKDLLYQSEMDKQRVILISTITGALILIVFSVFLFNRMRLISRQKEIIEEQKTEVDVKNIQLEKVYREINLRNEEIEEKNKDITDSIKYAKRIQEAILPPDEFRKELLPGSFVLYQPKDIVSGDFYWFERFGKCVMFAAVDCTGHGVPGAFMSIVGNNLLNRAVNEFGLSKPHLILNSVNRELTKTLHQESEESSVKDGMDISLCSFDPGTMKLEFSAAYNPLYLIRESQLIIVEGDKFPVGAFVGEEIRQFSLKEIALQKGDVLYIFTDGYSDQFGGPRGKKFKYRQLQQLLLSVHLLPPEQQKEKLLRTFLDWKGELEQVDDICIIGLRV
ncbi:MAG: tetratricopeptide repeat protein [Bacteroidia bacterium]|nr:tetratricopeptide repeat protein [Bacteroidia bacterium]